MTIKYVDHLHEASTEISLSVSAVTRPRSIGTPVDLKFSFTSSFSSAKLDEQSQVFLSLVRGNSKFTSTLDRYISLPYSERDSAIRDAYKYSFIKTYSAMDDLIENGFNYFGAVPSNSLVFYGHKMLYYTFLNYNIFTPSLDLTSNVYMTRTLSLDPDAMDEIKKESVWIASYNPSYPGGVFNSNFERILSAFSEIPELQVSLLSDQSDIPRDRSSFSLGSMAYTNKAKPNFFSTMEDSLATVSVHTSLTDHISKFWNSACFISIDSIPDQYTQPDNGSPYTYIRASLVNSHTVFAMVESITGLNNRGMYSTYGTNIPGVGIGPIGSQPFPPNSGPNLINPTSGYNPGGNNPYNNNNNNGQSPSPNGNGPNGQGSGPTGSNRNQNRFLRDALRNKANQIGRALTSDEAKQFLKEAALSTFGSHLASRRQKDLIRNLEQESIVSDTKDVTFGLPLNLKREKRKTVLAIKPKE